MVRENVGRSGIAHAGGGSDRAVGGERCRKHRGLHEALHERRRRTLERRPRPAIERGERRFGGIERCGQRGAEPGRFHFERLRTADVTLREARDLGRVGRLVATEQERSSIRERGERCGVLAVRIVAVAGQFEVGDDTRVEQAADVRGDRDAISRPHLLGDGGAAEDIAAFEDDRSQSGTRTVRRGDEPVVPATDDRDVEGFASLQRRFRPFGFACLGENGAPTTYEPRLGNEASTSSQPIGVNAPQSCGRAS